MFSDIDLVNSETFGDVWKFAHNIDIGNTEKVNLPNICKELNSLVTSVSVKANRRLSLRASSNLVGGAAKLYRYSMDKLFDDVIQMEEDLIYRRKRDRLDSSSSESSASTAESMVEDPEAMTRSATVGFMNSSFSPTKRIRTEPILEITPRITMSRSPSDKLISNGTNCNEEVLGECTNDGNCATEDLGTTASTSSDGNTGKDVEEPFSEEGNPGNQRKDEVVPTSPVLSSRNKNNKASHKEKVDSTTGNSSRNRQDRGTNIGNIDADQGFDRSLPFGYILIHDNYESRIPSRIIFTSINSDVNKLF